MGLSEDERRLQRYHKTPVPPAVAVRARQILRAEKEGLALDQGEVVFGVARGRARSGRTRLDDTDARTGASEDFGDD